MSENDIMKISDTIIRIAQPQKLLLFGSGATGTMNSLMKKKRTIK